MTELGRHRLPLFLVLSIGLGAPAAERSGEDERADWLARNAVRVRAIDPEDEDFADLEPLVERIGNARVVALGEQSHGDGATFLAKHRLVRFLHRRMGFDVLAFESGLFDCRRMEAALRTEMPLDAAAGAGLFPIWTKSALVLDLFEYVRSTHETPRPIEVCGFDCQFSGSAREGFPEFVEEFLSRPDPMPLGEGSDPVASVRWIAAHLRQEEPGGAGEDLERHRAAVACLVETLGSRAGEIARAHAPREIAFAKRALENLLVYDEVRRSKRTGDPSDTNLRDRRMGENLAWLAREFYPDRKIVVWAASFHLLREAPSIEVLHGRFTYERTVPMGQVAADALGRDYYAVAFTAHGGTAGNPFAKSFSLSPLCEGSLEDLFGKAGFEHAFLDFRALPAGGEWLRERLVSRPLGYSDMRADWTRCFDALVFTKAMFPSSETMPAAFRTARPRSPDAPADPVASALEAFRRAVVGCALDQASLLKGDPPDGFRADRLDSYPGPEAWPRVHGWVQREAKRFASLPSDAKGYASMSGAEGGFAWAEPFTGTIVSENYQTHVFLRGVAREGVVTLGSYASAMCRGPFAGKGLLPSYATVVIEGDLSGDLTAQSYFAGRIGGNLTGRLALENLAKVCLLGRLEGEVSLHRRAMLWIAGRTDRTALERVRGDGTVYLEDSDLSVGEHAIGTLKVVVTGMAPR